MALPIQVGPDKRKQKNLIQSVFAPCAQSSSAFTTVIAAMFTHWSLMQATVENAEFYRASHKKIHCWLPSASMLKLVEGLLR